MAKDSRLAKVGVSGYNRPKRTPKHKTKSHVVVAKVGGKVKTIRFGQQGVTGDRKTQHVRVRLRLGMVRTLPKARCQQHIGRTGLNGNSL